MNCWYCRKKTNPVKDASHCDAMILAVKSCSLVTDQNIWLKSRTTIINFLCVQIKLLKVCLSVRQSFSLSVHLSVCLLIFIESYSNYLYHSESSSMNTFQYNNGCISIQLISDIILYNNVFKRNVYSVVNFILTLHVTFP